MDGMIELVKRGMNLLSRFEPIEVDFLKWLNCFEFVADFLEVTEETEAEFLLYMLEPSVYEILALLVTPYDPFEFSYKELISMLEQTYSYFRGDAAAEYRFKNRKQMYGENVSHYANALTLIINECSSDFYTTENLINQFIHGLILEESRTRLLQEQNLTYYNAVLIAQEIEIEVFGTCCPCPFIDLSNS